MQYSAIILCIIAHLAFAVMEAGVKLAGSMLPVMQIVCVRSLAIMLFLIALMRLRGVPLFGKHHGILFWRSSMGFLALGLNFYAMSHTRLADAAILFQTFVIFSALLGVFWLGEKGINGLWWHVMLGFLGAVLVIKPEFGQVNLGALAALSAGFLSACAYTSIRHMHDKEHPLTIVFMFSLYSAVFSGLAGLQTFENLKAEHILGLSITAASSIVGQVLMTWALNLAPSSLLAPFGYLGAAFAAILGWLFWSEIPDVQALAGMLIIVGVGFVILRNQRIVRLG